MCGNEIKPQTLASPAVYKHFNVYCRYQYYEESEKEENFIMKKSLRPVPSQGLVKQSKKHGTFRPQRGYPEKRLKTPESEVAEDCLMEDIIK